MNRDRLLERFLRYVQIDTTARESAETYPSSSGQLELGKILADELVALGIAAEQDQHGIVLATVPSTVDGAAASADTVAAGAPVPTIAFCAHLDTSAETTGAGVKPQVIRRYEGGNIVLPGDSTKVILVDENPELKNLVGCTLITSDGTTLLGADDKAGVAVIMETAAWLMEHPEIQHGPVRLVFTCDEEIGRGVDKLNLDRIDATVCYTLDGQGANEIDVETFSADVAVIHVRGVNIHPSIGKDRMTNALRVAANFIERLPRNQLSPETTQGREGFIHPYQIEGGVGEVRLRVILRDFDTAKLEEYAQRLRVAAADSMLEFKGAQIEVELCRQYRNMADGLVREPRAVGYAQQALSQLGRDAQLAIVRGGTDGSRLTELGLPTPNLSTGQHAPHSPLEWACLDEMIQSVEWLIALTTVWCELK